MDSILKDALKLVRGSRNRDYGDPTAMYSVVADLWSAVLSHKLHTQVDLNAEDALLMMSLMKMGREIVRHKRDNLVDASGYMELLAVAHGEAEL